MANTLFLKEVSTYALTDANPAALANLVATTLIGVNLDNRSSNAGGGNSAAAIFQLQCQWNATSGITVGTDVVDLYLLPAMDGSTFPTIGTSQVSPNHYAGSFICPITTVAVSTIITFTTPIVDLFPVLYKAAIINQSGQTIVSSYAVKVDLAQGSYS